MRVNGWTLVVSVCDEVFTVVCTVSGIGGCKYMLPSLIALPCSTLGDNGLLALDNFTIELHTWKLFNQICTFAKTNVQ